METSNAVAGVESDVYHICLTFPGDLEYISSVRRFVADVLQRKNFDQKFVFRSEIIVDEICTNAVTYGMRTLNSTIDFNLYLYRERFEIEITDSGASDDNIRRLRTALDQDSSIVHESDILHRNTFGLELVKMLSDKVELNVSSDNVVSVKVIRTREE